MLSKLKPKSEFTKNVLTLMTGTTIAQAIPIAISPILTRIYTPEDFGVFAIFVAIVSILGSIANINYEYAIMLPNKDEDAINIVALGVIIISLFSLICLFIVTLFNSYLTRLLNNKDISIWLYFVPIAVFFIGLYNLLNYYNNRKKYYKDLANATIVRSLVLVTLQLGISFFKNGALGLIIGQVVSNIFVNIKLLKNLLKDRVIIKKINKVKILALAKRYSHFPKFSLWATLTNVASQQFTNILISVIYGVSTLGFYNLVQRVLAMPSMLIGSAISKVFFQESVKEKHLTGKTIKTFDSTVKKLFFIGIVFFFCIYFLVEDLFSFVFGENWRIAGEYAKIMIPLFFVRFVSSSVSMINIVFEKNKNGLYINFSLFITSLLIVYISHIYSLEAKVFLKLFSFILSIEYIIFIVYYYYLSRGKFEKATE